MSGADGCSPGPHDASSFFLGAGARAAGAPIALDPNSPELRVARMTSLFEATLEASSVAPLGAYLGVVQPSPAPVVVLDPVVEERLRALGYAN
jgi:hypothetical protein